MANTQKGDDKGLPPQRKVGSKNRLGRVEGTSSKRVTFKRQSLGKNPLEEEMRENNTSPNSEVACAVDRHESSETPMHPQPPENPHNHLQNSCTF